MWTCRGRESCWSLGLSKCIKEANSQLHLVVERELRLAMLLQKRETWLKLWQSARGSLNREGMALTQCREKGRGTHTSKDGQLHMVERGESYATSTVPHTESWKRERVKTHALKPCQPTKSGSKQKVCTPISCHSREYNLKSKKKLQFWTLFPPTHPHFPCFDSWLTCEFGSFLSTKLMSCNWFNILPTRERKALMCLGSKRERLLLTRIFLSYSVT